MQGATKDLMCISGLLGMIEMEGLRVVLTKMKS
jgi:hypothetical protein